MLIAVKIIKLDNKVAFNCSYAAVISTFKKNIFLEALNSILSFIFASPNVMIAEVI